MKDSSYLDGLAWAQGYDSYNAYLASPHWRNLRRRYRQSRKWRCFVCRTPGHKGFHLHHLTYERLGNERLNDLQPLCEGCHDGLHRWFKRQKDKNLATAAHRYRASLKRPPSQKWVPKRFKRGNKWVKVPVHPVKVSFNKARGPTPTFDGPHGATASGEKVFAQNPAERMR